EAGNAYSGSVVDEGSSRGAYYGWLFGVCAGACGAGYGEGRQAASTLGDGVSVGDGCGGGDGGADGALPAGAVFCAGGGVQFLCVLFRVARSVAEGLGEGRESQAD